MIKYKLRKNDLVVYKRGNGYIVGFFHNIMAGSLMVEIYNIEKTELEATMSEYIIKNCGQIKYDEYLEKYPEYQI